MNKPTEELDANESGIARAAQILTSGGLVSFPSETVYGLGGDARNGQTVAAIYEAKGRPSFNPLIVHVLNAQNAQRYVTWSDSANILCDTFWPGPLTLVLPLRKDHALSSLVTAGLPSLAVRAPAHPVTQALLAAFDGPLAGPSANPSGRISPTTSDHVLAGLRGRIDAVLDGGPCTVGLESTIVGLTGAQPVLLREGGVTREAIETALDQRLILPESGKITAPGQISSHYAPKAQVRLNATKANAPELLIGFGDVSGEITLSATGDLCEAAANLFGTLHRADAINRPIAIAPIPDHGLGAAINDRLRRAAAPR